MEIPVETGSLRQAIEAWEEGVVRLIEESEELAEYVRRLETAAEENLTEEQITSGDAIAAELERYLREQGPDSGRS